MNLSKNSYLVLLAVAVLVGALVAAQGGVLEFLPTDANDVGDLLTPLLLIALFIERAVEVLITSWRSLKKGEIDAELEAARATNAPVEEINRLEKSVREYCNETLRYAFLAATAMGLFVAICGVRVLEPLTDIELAAELWREQAVGYGLQGIGFRLVDIIITAGMLAGGANGIHKVLMLFLDFVDRTRERIPTRSDTNPANGSSPP